MGLFSRFCIQALQDTAEEARRHVFMNYKAAELRLRRALIPSLQGGRANGPVQSLFAQIFDR
jgi:hypothetical protein